jgi:hypothetical protein
MVEKLKVVLQQLPREAIERVASECKTTPEYLLEQVANGHRKASVRLARRLIQASDLAGLVELSDIRPDIWGDESLASEEAA